MRLPRVLGPSCALLLIGFAACNDSSAPSAPTDPLRASTSSPDNGPPTYLVTFQNAPSNLSAQLAQAGGQVKKMYKAAGIVSVTSSSPTFAEQARAIPGVKSVGLDRVFQWVDPNQHVVEATEDPLGSIGLTGTGIGADETFYNIQWAPKSIHAPEAWDAGARGAGVRVAVLDGGLNNNHIDLAGSVDVACSESMVSGFAFNQDVAGFSHATHVAGIIAARDNGIGTIGIAPGATIMGVKVLQNGSGSFEDVIEGIIYASNPGIMNGKDNCERADIINMSLGATFVPQPGDENLLAALSQATRYAYNQGSVVIASAGNNGLNLDAFPTVVTVPAMSDRVLAISATGPVGFALGATNFSRQASYTNFGNRVIDFGAPGGDFALPGNALCSLPRIPSGTITTACWVFDMVISPGTITTSNSGYFFAAGTSMAAPAAAGVAALIIERNHGSMNPSQVETALRRSADDLGAAGKDPVYGYGFVNALRALSARQ